MSLCRSGAHPDHDVRYWIELDLSEADVTALLAGEIPVTVDQQLQTPAIFGAILKMRRHLYGSDAFNVWYARERTRYAAAKTHDTKDDDGCARSQVAVGGRQVPNQPRNVRRSGIRA